SKKQIRILFIGYVFRLNGAAVRTFSSLVKFGEKFLLGNLHRRVGFTRPSQTGRMPRKASLLHMPNTTRPHPVALILGIKEFTIYEANAAGRPHTRGPGFHFSVGSDPQRPAPPGHTAFSTPPLTVAECDVG